MSGCLSVCLSVCIHACLCLYPCLSTCLCACLSVSVCLSPCLSACLSLDMDRQTHRWMDSRQTDKHTDGWTADRQTNTEMDGKQADRQTEMDGKQTDRQTEKTTLYAWRNISCCVSLHTVMMRVCLLFAGLDQADKELERKTMVETPSCEIIHGDCNSYELFVVYDLWLVRLVKWLFTTYLVPLYLFPAL